MKAYPALKFILAGIGALTLGAAAAAASCDLPRGKHVFTNACQICHSAEKGGGHATGPNLYGVLGRTAGKAKGFGYSQDLAEATGRWERARLDAFLAAPQLMFPGTAMAFAGLKNADDREAVLCFIESLADGPKATGASEKPLGEIASRLKEAERLWARRDGHAVSRLLYADDGLILGQGEKEFVSGRDAIDKLVGGLVGGAAKVEIKLLDGRMQGRDAATTWVRWNVFPVNGQENPFQVVSLFAWRREPGGWRVVSDMYAMQ
jgi:cytochrome c